MDEYQMDKLAKKTYRQTDIQTDWLIHKLIDRHIHILLKTLKCVTLHITHKTCDTKHYNPIQLHKYKHTRNKQVTYNKQWYYMASLEFFIYPYIHILSLSPWVSPELERVSCIGFLVGQDGYEVGW